MKGPGHANNDEDHEPGEQKAQGSGCGNGNPAGGAEPHAEQCGCDQSGSDGIQFQTSPDLSFKVLRLPPDAPCPMASNATCSKVVPGTIS